MRALQKIIRNGNSAQVTIPRPLLIALDWLPGEPILLEMQEDKSLIVRRPTERDFAPRRSTRVLLQEPAPTK